MSDRAKKITELTALTSPANTDVLVIHDASANATKQITVLNLTDTIYANTLVVTGNSTPANSSVTVTKGTIFYDTSFLYIAVADNTLKRIPLSTF